MSTMTLQLPSSYVDMDREEMEYVDGGWTLYEGITTLGEIAMAIGAFGWSIGSTHTATSYQSKMILTFIIGAAMASVCQITMIEKTAWNTLKIYYTPITGGGGGW